LKFLVKVAVFLAVVGAAKAQTLEDVLRLNEQTNAITARAGSMGVAYNGLTDDLATLYYNPAGLILIPKTEFNIGFGHNMLNRKHTIGMVAKDDTPTSSYLSNLGVAFPMKVGRQKISLGFSYFNTSSYDNAMNLEGVLGTQSAISREAKFGNTENRDSWATSLRLADIDAKGNITSIYQSGLKQDLYISEIGGMDQIASGVAFDLNENFSIGATVIAKFGTYEFIREYSEYDGNNKYNSGTPYDLDRLTIRNKYEDNISGVTAKFGFSARGGDNFRIGMAIELPTNYSITKTFSADYQAYYTNNGSLKWSPYRMSTNDVEYEISTPFVFSMGMSYKIQNLIMTLGGEYSDQSQINVNNASGWDADYTDINKLIASDLASKAKLGFGLEYTIPGVPVILRASGEYMATPYTDEITNFPSEILTYRFGLGYVVGNNIRIDASANFASYSANSKFIPDNYGDNPRYYSTNYTPLGFAAGITYRF
jgi:hypothetical protein